MKNSHTNHANRANHINRYKKYIGNIFVNVISIVVIPLVIISLICITAHTSSENKFLKKEQLAQQQDMETRIGNLIEENYQLYSRLVQYENTDVLYSINFIMSKNNRIDVKLARRIAESVVEHSAQFELDYKLVLAVIWQESRFNTTAKSSQNAHGLMQLIPDTQRALAKILKIETWDITDIDTNVLFGTAYLARLKRIYKNDLKMVLSAYNGGPVCAKRYQRYINGELPVDSLSVENVGYVKSITNMYKKM